MRSAAVAGFLALALAFPSLGAAQGAPEPEEAPEAVSMPRDGVPGVWLPLPAAREALAAVDDRPRLQRRLRLLETRLELADARVELHARAAELADQARGYLDNVVEGALEARREAERRASDPWRSPILWGIVGLVVGAAGAIAAALAL